MRCGWAGARWGPPRPRPNPKPGGTRTLTLQPLLHQPPEQAAAVVTEGGAHVVINLEPVRHVDVETFFLELEWERVQAGGHRPAPAPPSTTPLPPAPGMATGLARLHQGLGNPEVQGGNRRHGEGGRASREGVGRPSPTTQPSRPTPSPGAPPHYGVPAIGCRACAPADDLVDALLVDGSVTFLRRHRPERGMGRHGERQPVSRRPPAPSSPLHKAAVLPGGPHPHPTEPQAQSLIFLFSCQPCRRSLEGMGPGGRGPGAQTREGRGGRGAVGEREAGPPFPLLCPGQQPAPKLSRKPTHRLKAPQRHLHITPSTRDNSPAPCTQCLPHAVITLTVQSPLRSSPCL